MQIYIPHRNYIRCAAALDTETLKKQRENAEKLIYFFLCAMNKLVIDKKYKKEFNKIQKNPIYMLWWNGGKPFIQALFKYYDACNFELFNRKVKLEKILHFKKLIQNLRPSEFNPGFPPRNKRITTGYRIILLCINEKYYKNKYFLTLKHFKDTIIKLRNSEERFKFAKFLGLKVIE